MPLISVDDSVAFRVAEFDLNGVFTVELEVAVHPSLPFYKRMLVGKADAPAHGVVLVDSKAVRLKFVVRCDNVVETVEIAVVKLNLSGRMEGLQVLERNQEGRQLSFFRDEFRAGDRLQVAVYLSVEVIGIDAPLERVQHVVRTLTIRVVKVALAAGLRTLDVMLWYSYNNHIFFVLCADLRVFV